MALVQWCCGASYFLLLQHSARDNGDDHPETMLERLSLAYTHCKLGQYKEAAALVEMVRGSWCRRFGTKHPGIIHVRRALFCIHRNMGATRHTACV